MKVLVVQSCPTLCDPVDCHKVQASRSMGFSRQEHWSGLPCLPNPGIEPGSPGLQAHSLPSELPGKPTVTRAKVINSDLGPKPSPAPQAPFSLSSGLDPSVTLDPDSRALPVCAEPGPRRQVPS